MSKQTSVEWLQQEYEFNKILTNQDFGIGKEMLTYKEFEQAKEMHKQEMEKTWFDSTLQFDNSAEMTNKKLFEDYYQETFVSKGSDEHIVDANEMIKIPQPKETLYTEEQVIAIVEKSRATGLTAEYIIESLKQPKKD